MADNDRVLSAGPASGDGRNRGSDLCTQCGLCCMGVIHRVAALDGDEIAAASALGLEVLPTERPLFALPCPRLEGTICQVYGSRPRTCGRYKCQVLQDLEAGVATMDEARRRTTNARRLLGDLREVMPEHMSHVDARRLAYAEVTEETVAATGLSRSATHRLKLLATALDLYIDKFFRRPTDRKAFHLASLGEGKKE